MTGLLYLQIQAADITVFFILKLCLHISVIVIKFFAWKTTVFVRHTYETHIQIMRKVMEKCKVEKDFSDNGKYYVLKKKAVPEVLLKVVEAKRLLESEKAISIQEATDQVGLSRSSFYKYKDDIFPFHDNARGKTITFVLQMDDEPGLLSVVLGIIAKYNANILTIHQTIPINGVASLTLSIEILPNAKNVSELIEEIETKKGIHYLKILARE